METLPWVHPGFGHPEDLEGYHTICPHSRRGIQGAHAGPHINSPHGIETPAYQ